MVAMEWAMITRDFSLQYVQDHGSRSTPALYNFTAVWSALEGSILLWIFALALSAAVVAWRYRRRLDDELISWAIAVICIVMVFFFVLSFGPANPFAEGAPGVTDGPGPNPLLQNHILVLFHPPILYLGYVGFTVPFAFAIAALITGRVGEGWLIETRRWTLFAWGFLTVGIILGGWWSYEVLGWSGVWAWDPVENASLLPWLTGTAYIHSVLVQERRGMLRVWNLSLLLATFKPHDSRYVPHSFGCAEQCACLQRKRHRHLPARLLRSHRSRVARSHRLARRPAAFTRVDRLTRVA